MAFFFDAILLTIQYFATPWRRARALVIGAAPLFASFGGAIEFIFTPQTSNVTGGNTVGGIDQVIELAATQLEVTVLALALALADRPAAGPLLRPQGSRRTGRGRARQRRPGDPGAGPDRADGGGDRGRAAAT